MDYKELEDMLQATIGRLRQHKISPNAVMAEFETLNAKVTNVVREKKADCLLDEIIDTVEEWGVACGRLETCISGYTPKRYFYFCFNADFSRVDCPLFVIEDHMEQPLIKISLRVGDALDTWLEACEKSYEGFRALDSELHKAASDVIANIKAENE